MAATLPLLLGNARSLAPALDSHHLLVETVNRRIRKKLVARQDAMIADGLRLYATRPNGPAYEALARDLLSLQIGLALYKRFQIVAGPRRGWGVAPPSSIVIEHANGQALRARGMLQLLPPGDQPAVDETFHLSAMRTHRGWRHVLLTFGAVPGADEQAV